LDFQKAKRANQPAAIQLTLILKILWATSPKKMFESFDKKYLALLQTIQLRLTNLLREAAAASSPATIIQWIPSVLGQGTDSALMLTTLTEAKALMTNAEEQLDFLLAVLEGWPENSDKNALKDWLIREVNELAVNLFGFLAQAKFSKVAVRKYLQFLTLLVRKWPKTTLWQFHLNDLLEIGVPRLEEIDQLVVFGTLCGLEIGTLYPSERLKKCASAYLHSLNKKLEEKVDEEKESSPPGEGSGELKKPKEKKDGKTQDSLSSLITHIFVKLVERNLTKLCSKQTDIESTFLLSFNGENRCLRNMIPQLFMPHLETLENPLVIMWLFRMGLAKKLKATDQHPTEEVLKGKVFHDEGSWRHHLTLNQLHNLWKIYKNVLKGHQRSVMGRKKTLDHEMGNEADLFHLVYTDCLLMSGNLRPDVAHRLLEPGFSRYGHSPCSLHAPDVSQLFSRLIQKCGDNSLNDFIFLCTAWQTILNTSAAKNSVPKMITPLELVEEVVSPDSFLKFEEAWEKIAPKLTKDKTNQKA
jgi:hypothetical protein